MTCETITAREISVSFSEETSVGLSVSLSAVPGVRHETTLITKNRMRSHMKAVSLLKLWLTWCRREHFTSSFMQQDGWLPYLTAICTLQKFSHFMRMCLKVWQENDGWETLEEGCAYFGFYAGCACCLCWWRRHMATCELCSYYSTASVSQGSRTEETAKITLPQSVARNVNCGQPLGSQDRSKTCHGKVDLNRP